MGSTWLEVGLGLNGAVRDFLERLKLHDPTLRWHEGRGFITRRYDVIGSPSSIARINQAALEFSKAMKAKNPPDH
ncbi:MAG: hypothetical protein WC655_27750 [Candidatus Hydrogenedentales bacterium]|jgi:hypothetical protein